MKRFFIYICMLIVLMTTFTSCKGKEIEEIPVGTKTIVFSTFYDEGAQAEAYKEIVTAFENSHKDIKVSLQAGAVNYDEKVKSALQAGKGPDIMGLQRSSMIEYIKSGYVKDITSFIESENLKDKLYGVSLGYGKYDGKYYGYGDMPQTVEWFYNTKMFKKAGLNEPQNLNELLKVCNKLKGYTQQVPIMVGAKDSWVMDTFFGMITVQTIDTNELSKAFASGDKQSFINLQGGNSAADIVGQMVKSGALSRKLTDYDYDESIDAFVNGKTAILPMGSWAIDKIEKTKPKGFSYKVFAKPVIFSDNPYSQYSATAIQDITVNAKTKHSKETMEFMKFLVSEEAQKIFAEKNGVSCLKSANQTPEDPVKAQIIKHLEMTDENSTLYIDNVSSKMMDTTGIRIMQLITGKQKPAEVWNLIAVESNI